MDEKEGVSVFPFLGFQRLCERSFFGAKRWTLLGVCSDYFLVSPQEPATPRASTCTRPDEITVVPEERESSPRLLPPPPENFKCPHRIMYYAVARLRIARKRDSVSSRGSALLLLLLFFAPWNIYFAPRRNESEILIGRRCSSSLCVIFREYFPLENFPKFFATYSLCVYFFGSLIFR